MTITHLLSTPLARVPRGAQYSPGQAVLIKNLTDAALG